MCSSLAGTHTKHPTDTIDEQTGLITKSDVGRPFSPDLKNGMVDNSDVCATSDDLCRLGIPRAGVLRLPDGRNRMCIRTSGALTSHISAMAWSGRWKTASASQTTQPSIYEQGHSAASR
jgi:hypothetical protein